MLNVALLRKTQESILDPSRNFDMDSWSCCIAGHLVRTARKEGIVVDELTWQASPWQAAGKLAGISESEAFTLFHNISHTYSTRELAVRRIDDLIARLGNEEKRETALVIYKAPTQSQPVEEEDLVCV